MDYAPAPDAIDTRIVFRIYAIAGIAASVFIQIGLVRVVDRPSAPSTAFAHVAMAASGLWALTYYASAFARVEDPRRRLAALKEFASAHLLIGIAIWTMDSQARGMDIPSTTWAAWVIGAVLVYLAYTASRDPRATIRIRTTGADGHDMMMVEKGGAATMRRLRTEYEDRIRKVARQEERARLARDLHDAVKQQLFVIQTAAATAQARFASDPAGAQLAVEHVRTAAREAIAEMAAMLDQLQAAPLENVGLVEALKKQCEALGFRTGAAVDFAPGPLPPAALLPPGAHEAMLRVAQESLANVARHARAQRIVVRLHVHDRSLVLEVRDDGAGFDPLQSRGMGIGNMQARAGDVGGRFELASSPGTGTTVTFAIPFATRSRREYRAAAAIFAAALALGAALLAWAPRATPLWWLVLAGTAIAAIALLRNLGALRRVYTPDKEGA
jgi:signal transduction histidine kinase